MAVLLQHLLEGLIGHRRQETPEHIVGAHVANAIAGGASASSQADGEMAFADAAGAQEKDRLAAVEEAELGEVEKGLAMEAGLELEVVILEGVGLGEIGFLEAALGGGLVPPQHLGGDHAGQK